ncbi:hypothetical protein MRB53_038970 [Persea americana]|nr:hypothetical protein MRB53_038970 [Persea americana]
MNGASDRISCPDSNTRMWTTVSQIGRFSDQLRLAWQSFAHIKFHGLVQKFTDKWRQSDINLKPVRHRQIVGMLEAMKMLMVLLDRYAMVELNDLIDMLMNESARSQAVGILRFSFPGLGSCTQYDLGIAMRLGRASMNGTSAR